MRRDEERALLIKRIGRGVRRLIGGEDVDLLFLARVDATSLKVLRKIAAELGL